MQSTYGSEADAKAAATMLVEKRLVVCAQVSPLWSTYRWKGNIESGEEWMLHVKVVPADQDDVWEMILDRHPYETPCLELLGSAQVPAPYMRWAERVTR